MPDSFRCLESGSKLVRALPKIKTRFHGSRKCFPLKHVLHVKAVLHDHEFVLINSVPDSYLKVCTLGQRNFCPTHPTREKLCKMLPWWNQGATWGKCVHSRFTPSALEMKTSDRLHAWLLCYWLFILLMNDLIYNIWCKCFPEYALRCAHHSSRG